MSDHVELGRGASDEGWRICARWRRADGALILAHEDGGGGRAWLVLLPAVVEKLRAMLANGQPSPACHCTHEAGDSSCPTHGQENY